MSVVPQYPCMDLEEYRYMATLSHVGDDQGWPGDKDVGAARVMASLAVSTPDLLVPSEKEGG